MIPTDFLFAYYVSDRLRYELIVEYGLEDAMKAFKLLHPNADAIKVYVPYKS